MSNTDQRLDLIEKQFGELKALFASAINRSDTNGQQSSSSPKSNATEPADSSAKSVREWAESPSLCDPIPCLEASLEEFSPHALHWRNQLGIEDLSVYSLPSTHPRTGHLGAVYDRVRDRLDDRADRGDPLSRSMSYEWKALRLSIAYSLIFTQATSELIAFVNNVTSEHFPSDKCQEFIKTCGLLERLVQLESAQTVVLSEQLSRGEVIVSGALLGANDAKRVGKHQSAQIPGLSRETIELLADARKREKPATPSNGNATTAAQRSSSWRPSTTQRKPDVPGPNKDAQQSKNLPASTTANPRK